MGIKTAAELSVRLTEMSNERAWTVFSTFEWPESLDPETEYCMSPELISIYGTKAYEQLNETERKRLSFYELGNFFSFVLLGEQPVVMGLTDRMYRKDTIGPITDYLHHFVDEENRHMMMFSGFLNRYLGKVYPEKKLVFDRKFAKGEEEVVFYCRVLIVEELGDFYNLKMLSDERINPLVREINKMHHMDESRHLAFGRTWAAELFKKHSSQWDEEALASFRKWLADYFASSWTDFYNPTMYKDAGLENSYEIRQMALQNPTCREFREQASARLVKYFLKNGFLTETPAL